MLALPRLLDIKYAHMLTYYGHGPSVESNISIHIDFRNECIIYSSIHNMSIYLFVCVCWTNSLFENGAL